MSHSPRLILLISDQQKRLSIAEEEPQLSFRHLDISLKMS
ncbi:hypothetical protein HMPREF0201_01933 [Cedecea davisae DSM 4568]|uniref:Uncharacterized protein n=1 Tax=Cedecea davisae DSM 4568 TaxID=566551 RepID=S3IYK5_9ENTR|nr:hypothetical protein HMPREF0201_01933 [Cedecea davisae DSM 4568]